MADIDKKQLKPKKLRKTSSPGAIATALSKKPDAAEVQALIDASVTPAIPPTKTLVYHDDFLADFGTYVGETGYEKDQQNDGSVAIYGPPSVSNGKLGIVELQSGVDPNGRGGISQTNNNPFICGDGYSLTFEALVYISTVSANPNQYALSIGFSHIKDAYNASVGAFIYSDPSFSHWQVYTANVSGWTDTKDNLIPITVGWHKFTVEINAAGTSVVYKVDGEIISTHTTNIPVEGSTDSFGLAISLQNASASLVNKFVYVDYVTVTATFTTER